MQSKNLFHFFLVSVLVQCCFVLVTARYIEEDELPAPNAPSEKSLQDQQKDIQQCWKDAGVGHGPNSADPYFFTPKERSTSAEECAKLTTWFEDCKCFISVLRKDGTQVMVKYYPPEAGKPLNIESIHKLKNIT